MPCEPGKYLADSMEFNYASHKSDGKERKKGTREKATGTERGGKQGIERKNGRRVYVIASCVNMIVGSRPGAYLRTNYAT